MEAKWERGENGEDFSEGKGRSQKMRERETEK